MRPTLSNRQLDYKVKSLLVGLWLVTALATAHSTERGPTLFLLQDQARIPLTQAISYLEDPSGSLAIKDLLAPTRHCRGKRRIPVATL